MIIWNYAPEAQGLVVEWGGEREGKGMSFGRVGMLGSVGLGRSVRWGRGGTSGSFGTSSFGKGGSSGFSKAGTCGTVGNSGLGKVGNVGSGRVGTWGRGGSSALGRVGSSGFCKVGSVGRCGNSTLGSSGTLGSVVSSRRWRDAKTSLPLIRDRVRSSRGNRMDGWWWWAISELLKDLGFWIDGRSFFWEWFAYRGWLWGFIDEGWCFMRLGT